MQIHDATSNLIARTYTRGTTSPLDAPGRLGQRTAAGRPRTDSVSLSGATQELGRLRSAVAAQPDVRADRVAELKAAIRNGTYRVDNGVLAAKLLG